MTNEELAVEIRRGRTDLLEQLWLQCEKFIRRQALSWTTYAELDDLMQEGYIILADCVFRFEQREDSSFIAYLASCLKYGWIQYLARAGTMVSIPANMIGQIRKYNKIRQRYLQQFGEEPPSWYMRGNMELTDAELDAIRKAARCMKTRSLNEQIQQEDNDKLELEDLVADPNDYQGEVIERLDDEQLRKVLWEIVDELPALQAEVIRSVYKDNESVPACAERIGVTYLKARTAKDRGIQLLKRKRSKLLPLLQESEIYGRAVKGVSQRNFAQDWTSATEREAIRLTELMEWTKAFRAEWLRETASDA